MTYEGILLSEHIEGGRKAGTITTNPFSLTFKKGDDVEIKFPLKDLEVSYGGAGKRLVYFKHPQYPGYTMHTGQSQILDDSALSHLFTIQDTRQKAKRSRLTLGALIIATILVIGAGVAVFFVSRNDIIRKIAMRVPMEYQIQIGKPLFDNTLKGSKTLTSDTLSRYLNELTRPLLSQLADSEYQFQFAVVENDAINAFALPGGFIVIHSALLQEAESPDEVAGVLAHEIAHVTSRHHLRGLFNRLGTFYILSMFLGDISVLGSLVDIGASLESLSFSRDFETESDLEGLKLALASGYSSEGMVSFFKKLGEARGEDHALMAYLNTHPTSDSRMKTIENTAATLPRLNTKRPDFFIDYTTFKRHLNTLLEKQ